MVNKILVVVLDNLGDAVMGTAVLNTLRQFYPEAKVGFWVKEYTAGLFHDKGTVDLLHASDPFWDTSPGLPKGSWRTFWRIFQRVRKEKYDLVFILNTDWRRSMVLWLARIPNRVGLVRHRTRFFLTVKVLPPPKTRHYIDYHQKLIEAWFQKEIPVEMFFPTLKLDVEEQEWAFKWRQELQWESRLIVGIHPFAGDPQRCWPTSRWAELVRLLIREDPDLRFVFVCGGSEAEKLNGEAFSLDRKTCSLLVSPIQHVKAVLSLCSLFIGGDSGPGHMAAALSVPVLSLFGESNPVQCAPRGRAPVRILKKANLNDLPAKEVLDEVRTLLASKVT